jgi:hypothetical protein
MLKKIPAIRKTNNMIVTEDNKSKEILFSNFIGSSIVGFCGWYFI